MPLTRARDSALLTIPPLVPPENNSVGTKYPTPYQGLGARGVNNLAAKLLLALFPPNEPFFRLAVDDMALKKMFDDPRIKGQLEKVFSSIERSVMRVIETGAMRIKLFEAIKQLLVAGNVLLMLLPTGELRMFRLDRYVVKRDPVGNVLEIITKEDLSPLAVPQNIRQACAVDVDDDHPENTIPLFSRLFREEDGTYSVYQELNGMEVPDSRGNYPADECPWMALRWVAVENEDYGRSMVEEHLGDLTALEGLSKSILESAAAASKVLFFVKPNSSTNKRRISEAPNGTLLDGNVDDVGCLQMDKYADFRVAFEQAQELTKRLSLSFLLNTSVQRNGERVTAEEIRYVANELEDALGGNYSVLSVELQLPLTRNVLRFLTNRGTIPELPKGIVSPAVITGMEAIGRGHDLTKLTNLAHNLEPLGNLAQSPAAPYFNVGEYINRICVASGIDTEGLIKDQAQVDQEAQQAQMAQAAQTAVPHIAKGGMDMLAASQSQPPQQSPK